MTLEEFDAYWKKNADGLKRELGVNYQLTYDILRSMKKNLCELNESVARMGKPSRN